MIDPSERLQGVQTAMEICYIFPIKLKDMGFELDKLNFDEYEPKKEKFPQVSVGISHKG